MKYVLGLDVGIASVGWAVLNLDNNRIEDLGVRAFNAAEDPKTKTPLAEPRRLARSARRRLRRRAGRLQRAKQLFVEHGLVSDGSFDELFSTADGKPEPWNLRAEGLDRLLSGDEFSRALFHIIKRRGFKSNRKKANKDDDEGQVKAGIEQNRKIMRENEYRTVGELFCRYDDFQDKKRNTTGSYKLCVERSMLEDEIRALFEAQRSHGSTLASSDFEKQFLNVFNWQLPFASGDAILSKVGGCTFESGEKRASRNSYTAERFILLSDINKLSWYLEDEKQHPTADQRKIIEDMAYRMAEVKYKQIKKTLKLPDDTRFASLTYSHRKNGVVEETLDCENTVFGKLSGYHETQRICEKSGVWDEVRKNASLMDDIAFALTFYKTEEDTIAYFSDRKLPEEMIKQIADSAGFSKVTHLSLKAMRNILPFLEAGDIYSVACEKAGYNHSSPDNNGERTLKLPVIGMEVTRNPVVLRALSQSRKVVNSIIDRYGSPSHINIEMAREIGKSADERGKISRRIEENRSAAQRDDEHFKEIFNAYPRTGEDRLKWRLYREQDGKCAYSQKPIDLENRFFEPGYVEIDHILPYSRSFDDSIANKSLVLSAENQNKRNQTPYEYFGHNESRWRIFEAWVTDAIRDPRKRRNLLIKEYGEEERNGWIPRNLVDTQFIARKFSQFVRESLIFADKDEKLPVICLSGRITSLLRGLWGLSKVREENDLHHAMDAAVIASVTPRLVRLVTEYRKARETMLWNVGDTYVDPETGEIIEFRFAFPQPWKGFRKELIARLSEDPAAEIERIRLDSYSDKQDVKPVLVSRKPIRKVTGPIHKETIRSIREQDGKRVSVIRTDVTKLTKENLKNLYAPETNEKLYAVIRERMEQYGWDAKKAFAEPLYKPTKDGTQGPLVRKVKLAAAQPSGVEVRGGIADNGSMVRTDVFVKDGKYYLVPVYTADFMTGRLPDRAITSNKPWDEWPVVDESYDFLFSLYPYDLVRIQTTKEEFFGYYRSCDRSTGALSICAPNKGDTLIRGIGARTALSIDKFEVGILGDFHRINKEVRRGLEDCGNNESCEAQS